MSSQIQSRPFLPLLLAWAFLLVYSMPSPNTMAQQIAAPAKTANSRQVLQQRIGSPAGRMLRRPATIGAGLLEEGAGLFQAAVNYPTSPLASSFSVVTADFNLDGNTDVAMANFCSDGFCQHGSVTVMLGKGDGTLGPPVSYLAGVTAYAVAVADFNGDGIPDLAVANFCARSVSPDCSVGAVTILLGNGDGTFGAPVSYLSGPVPSQSIAVGDFNLDGKTDVVVTSSSNTVSVLLGKGDGTFDSALTYSSGPGSTFTINSVVVADFNADGKPDLAVSNECAVPSTFCDSGSINLILGNGDGTFKAPVSYRSGGQHTSVISVADLNGDAILDLVATNECSDSVCLTGSAGVLLGVGDGTFRPAVSYPSSDDAVGLAVQDFDGDGVLDLAVIGLGNGSFTNSLAILLGNGDGTFRAPSIYNVVGNAVAAADLNRDGKPDLVVDYGFGIYVLLHKTKSATTTSLISTLNPSIYGQKVTWTATVTSSGSIMPTGTVRFKWQYFAQTFTIGSAILNSSGVATLTKSNLNADGFPLMAVYAGNSANLGSTSAILNQVVLETASTATLTSSSNPSKQGQAVTFTAKISSLTVTPTGPVTLAAGKTVLGMAQLSGGKATLTTSSLPVGPTKVTATYYGDSNIAKSSASAIQTVR